MFDARERCARLHSKIFFWIFVTILMIERQAIDEIGVGFRRPISVAGTPLYKHG